MAKRYTKAAVPFFNGISQRIDTISQPSGIFFHYGRREVEGGTTVPSGDGRFHLARDHVDAQPRTDARAVVRALYAEQPVAKRLAARQLDGAAAKGTGFEPLSQP